MTDLHSDPDIAAIARIGGVQTILEVVTQATGLRLALIARVTRDDWKACAVHDALGFGLVTGDHLEIATTLCTEVHQTGTPILIEHASQDATYSEHHTPKRYNFESYLAVPIYLANGEYFGNVCALDRDPLPLKLRRSQEMMEAFAKLIGLQLDAQKTSDLREQFIAVLGHDLRNPLSAMLMGTEFLENITLPEAAKKVVRRMKASSERMSRLVDDVVDFARGRLGGGIDITRSHVPDFDAVVSQVVSELQSAHEDREIRLRVMSPLPIHGDRTRLGQLISNLLANAVQHGAKKTPIEVMVDHDAHHVVLSVTNEGEPIPQEKLERIFEPYVRANEGGQGRSGGLGLGLYIASEIVRSHGGKLTVTSSREAGTTFRCLLPSGAV